MSHRAVYDTMVFYQWAVLPEGRLHGTAQAALTGAIHLCVSPALLAEVRDLLTRLAIQSKSKRLTRHRVDQLLEQITQHADFIADVPAVFSHRYTKGARRST